MVTNPGNRCRSEVATILFSLTLLLWKKKTHETQVLVIARPGIPEAHVCQRVSFEKSESLNVKKKKKIKLSLFKGTDLLTVIVRTMVIYFHLRFSQCLW